MTDIEVATVARLADICVAKGIRLLEVGGCRIELGPPREAPMSDKPSDDTERCRCGHPLHAHNNALCVLGCDPSQCVGPEAK